MRRSVDLDDLPKLKKKLDLEALSSSRRLWPRRCCCWGGTWLRECEGWWRAGDVSAEGAASAGDFSGRGIWRWCCGCCCCDPSVACSACGPAALSVAVWPGRKGERGESGDVAFGDAAFGSVSPATRGPSSGRMGLGRASACGTGLRPMAAAAVPALIMTGPGYTSASGAWFCAGAQTEQRESLVGAYKAK